MTYWQYKLTKKIGRRTNQMITFLNKNIHNNTVALKVTVDPHWALTHPTAHFMNKPQW